MPMPSQLDIIVPVYNEADNVNLLLERLASALKIAKVSYHVYFVDDRSSDTTVEILNSLKKKYPITIIRKKGAQGKAYSILEAVEHTKAEYLAMIDADLQYPPEVLPEMLTVAKQEGVAVARRNDNKENIVRKTLSKGFRWFFGKILNGLDCDVQSGLKIFKRDIIEQIIPDDVTPWTLDIPLLTNALNLGYSIGEVSITFAKRNSGESKIKFVSSISEIGGQAIKHKFTPRRPFIITPDKRDSMIGAGLVHKGKRFITHTTLRPSNSALDVVTQKQQLTIIGILITLVLFAIFLPLGTAKVVVGIMSFIYFMDVVFNFYLILKSLHNPPEIKITDEELAVLKDGYLPIYTILCPLYKEAHVIPQFLEAISKIEWPKEKLDVQLLLEQDDVESIEAVKKMKLPKYVRVVVVPDSQPKTKPKACNYGLSLAKGEYVVIYDAEDDPDPLQLKKSFIAFQKVGPNIKCLQAKLNYYNPNQNWLTRLFTAEYSLWFDVILTGMQSIETTIPLGGTSNHFRTADLIELEGWDPFNVTEDADLGVRLFSKGYKTAIIDSTTLEEANSNFKNWIRQRSRWIKGYMQTYLLHMRNPIELAKKQGIHALLFQLTVGGKISFILINPILWLLTIAYFTLYAYVGPTIESLYPSVIFYMAVISLIFGNFMFIYYYMIGIAKRENWTLMKWVYLIPFYWLMVSVAGAMALYQLIVKPHYWEKTIHGLHLKTQQEVEKIEEEVKEVSTDAISAVIDQANKQKPLITPFSFFAPNRIVDIFRSKILQNAVLPRLSHIKITETIDKIRSSLSNKAVRGGMYYIIASLVANLINVATNIYLGKNSSLENFGTINTLTSLIFLLNIPVVAFSSTTTHIVAKIGDNDQKHLIRSWMSLTRRKLLLISIILTGIWLLVSPDLVRFLHFQSYLPLILISPIILYSLLTAHDQGYLKGKLMFGTVALAVLFEPFVRLISSVAFHVTNLSELYPFTLTLGTMTAYWLSTRYVSVQKNDNDKSKYVLKFPKMFMFSCIITGLSAIAFFKLDTLIIAHVLSQSDTGFYALLGLPAKMIFFIGSLPTSFILPLATKNYENNSKGKKILMILVLLTIIFTLLGYLVFGVLFAQYGHLILKENFAAVSHLLPYYGIGVAAFGLSQVIVTIHLAKNKFIFPLTSFILSIFQVIALVLFVHTIQDAVIVMMITGIAQFFILSLLHFCYKWTVPFTSNLLDLFTIFSNKYLHNLYKSSEYSSEKSLRILIFNWRDIRHVWSGGAERYIHELAKELVTQGHKVTIFSGNDEKSPRNQVIDGVQIIRRGGFYTVYFWAFVYYILRLRMHTDVIIDSENGIPFMTPLYSRKPIILLIHHVHQEVFRMHLEFPLRQIAEFIEGIMMPLIYKDKEVVTVSESSKRDILKLGLGGKNQITVINPGISVITKKRKIKSKRPLLCYVGRLKPYKNVDIAIKAISEVAKTIPDIQFQIAGTGESYSELKSLIEILKLKNNVKLLGNISEEQKVSLFSRSWLAIQPSMIEGWGITVIEANACGTPVVASQVKGLEDSVIHNKTGWLIPVRNIKELSNQLKHLLKHPTKIENARIEAIKWAENFSWDKSANTFLHVINHAISKKFDSNSSAVVSINLNTDRKQYE